MPAIFLFLLICLSFCFPSTALIRAKFPMQKLTHQCVSMEPSPATSNMESVTPPAISTVNIKMDGIPNMRDLSTASKIRIKDNCMYRTGCVSKASDNDIAYLRDKIAMKTLIDLRSEAELKDDEHMSSKVYDGYKSFTYDRKRKHLVSDGTGASVEDQKRFFISLMSESLIKKGTFFSFKKRIRLLAVGLLALSPFSRRAEKKVRSIFLDKINTGGLSFLNELVLETSGKAIIEALKVIADQKNYPVAVYCTAGKDRTGLISMLVLHVLGASDEEILDDYVLSDSAYKEINDKKAMVASLKQVEVDPEIFLRAHRYVMEDTMRYLRTTEGSINAYLDKYGFDESWREKLRNSMLQA